MKKLLWSFIIVLCLIFGVSSPVHATICIPSVFNGRIVQATFDRVEYSCTHDGTLTDTIFYFRDSKAIFSQLPEGKEISVNGMAYGRSCDPAAPDIQSVRIQTADMHGSSYELQENKSYTLKLYESDELGYYLPGCFGDVVIEGGNPYFMYLKSTLSNIVIGYLYLPGFILSPLGLGDAIGPIVFLVFHVVLLCGIIVGVIKAIKILKKKKR